jgi:uncharacterized protein DUF6785/uncharacterized protein DUF6784
METREAVTRPAAAGGEPPSAEPPPGGRLTARAMLLALILQVGVIFWVVRTEITGRCFVSNWGLPMPAVLVLLVLGLLNGARKRSWRPAEVLLVYLTLTTTVTLVGYYFIQLLIPMMATPFYFATDENRWSRMHPFLPSWLTLRDPEVIRGLYLGGAAVPWRAWLVPLAGWGALILSLCAATLSLNVLLARQWIHRERITFPVATLPLEITSPRAPLLRNRLMWLGFGLAAVGQSLCATNYYLPAVPHIPLTITSISDSFTQPPWTALGAIYIRNTPFSYGLAFLAPTDVSFSVWFFFWLARLQRLVAFNLGYVDPQTLSERGAPYLVEQGIGAFLVMGVYLVSHGLRVKGQWSRVNRRRTEHPNPRPSTLDPRPSTLNPRPAALVFCVSIAVMTGILVSAGLGLGLTVGIIALYFLNLVTITRVRAEAGFAWVYGPHRWAGGNVTEIMGNSLGTFGLAPAQLTTLGLFHLFWWDVRFTPMPGQFEALKMGDSARIRQSQLVAWIVAVSVLAVLVGMYAALRDGYHYGMATAKAFSGIVDGSKVGYLLAMNWWDNPVRPDGTRTACSVVGGVVTYLLILARQRFLWWPFNPIGYVMGATNTATMFWANYFIAWLLKAAVLRYGGMRLYRSVVPFFIGLILGDIATQAAWSLATSILDVPVYQFLA